MPAKKNKAVSSDRNDKSAVSGVSADLIEEEILSARKDDDADFIIVRVVINRRLFSLFDYKLKAPYPENPVGCRVKVSFGTGKRVAETAVIVEIGKRSDRPLSSLKYAELTDKEPVISEIWLDLLRFGADYYHYPLGMAVLSSLPNILRNGEKASYRSMTGIRALVSREELEKAAASSRSDGQRRLIGYVKEGVCRTRELRDQGITSSHERALINKGLIERIQIENDRPSFSRNKLYRQYTGKDCDAPNDAGKFIPAEAVLRSSPLQLNDEQKAALEKTEAVSGFSVFLLNGITGSGKTEIYLQAIQETLCRGKKAMVLVPEIALTPQTFRRFYSRFKVPIVTQHSGMSDRERLDSRLDMMHERACIIIGTRSALFTPIRDLDLIIIDEEHDPSFKQSEGFRYHAVKMAVCLAGLCNCRIILGSATPSLESVYEAECGHYILLRLMKRAGNAVPPDIRIIDMRQDLSSNIKYGMSSLLTNMIGINSVDHRQSILFLNRRGTSRSLICRACRQAVQCAHCDAAMTYHADRNLLICHICGYSAKVPSVCPSCRASDSFIGSRVGTETIEKFLSMRFPDTGICRVDRDSVTTENRITEVLQNFASHRCEIAIGTQMLAKGHDFPDVTLVGILGVDGGLVSSDFRGLECTAQLITQVAGRAGRAASAGRAKVFIQSLMPEHQLLRRLTDPAFDYYSFACELLEIRKVGEKPPYTFQAALLCNSPDRNAAYMFLETLKASLERHPEIIRDVVSTPVLPDRIEKKFSRYHCHILLTSSSYDSLHKLLNAVNRLAENIKTDKRSDIRFAVETDPLGEP